MPLRAEGSGETNVQVTAGKELALRTSTSYSQISEALHEQPLPLWQFFDAEMQLLPHALPALQILQHFSAGMHAPARRPSTACVAASAAMTSSATASRVKHETTTPTTKTATAHERWMPRRMLLGSP